MKSPFLMDIFNGDDVFCFRDVDSGETPEIFMAILSSRAFRSGSQRTALLLYSTDFRREWPFLRSIWANMCDQNCIEVRRAHNHLLLVLYGALLAASMSILLCSHTVVKVFRAWMQKVKGNWRVNDVCSSISWHHYQFYCTMGSGTRGRASSHCTVCITEISILPKSEKSGKSWHCKISVSYGPPLMKPTTLPVNH